MNMMENVLPCRKMAAPGLRSGVSIWFGAVVWADNTPIEIGAGSNIQEGSDVAGQRLGSQSRNFFSSINSRNDLLRSRKHRVLRVPATNDSVLHLWDKLLWG